MAAVAYSRKLASDLIQEHFGDSVQKVWDCLANRGQLQLGEMVSFTGLGLPMLRNCLLVLIQHNCVQAFRIKQEGAFGSAAKQLTCYIAIVDNALHRLRFPKFLLLVRQELGDLAESLVSGLMQHGRLTLQQLLERAAECNQESGSDAANLKQTLAELVRCHYVERCPLPEPDLNTKEEQPKKKPRTGKARVPTIADSIQQRVVAVATLMESKRFQVPSSLEVLDDDDDEGAPESSVGQKRKRVEVADDVEVLWRVNYEEFLRRLRHQACTKFVALKLDAAAGTVLSCMLDATRRAEKTLRERYSESLTMDAIAQAVISTPAGRTMTLERVRPALIQMIEKGFISRAGDTGSHYSIDMQKIIELARQDEIEGTVLRRFGRIGYRLFRLLNTKGFSEHKQISGILGPEKDTWAILYQLLREKYIEYQDIPKTTDRAPSKSLYLWRIATSLSQVMLNDMYHGVWNLGRRLVHELGQEQELLSLLKRGVQLTGTQLQQANRLSNVAKVLEVSILKLDDAIMLFQDF